MLATRRTLLLLMLTALCATALSSLSGCDEGRVSITIDQDEVQRRVTEEFPQEHDLKGLATLTMKQPVVDLEMGDQRIGLTTDLEISRGNLPLAIKGKSKTSGKLRYEPSQGTFTMTDVRVEKLDFGSFGLLGADKKKQLLDTTNAVIQGSLRDIPIYTLQTTSSKEAAKLLLKEIKVEQRTIRISLGP